MTEPLTIEELTGSQRSVSLTDRALPYRPVAFPGEQRTEKTSYPGNPVSTIQVLGPDETAAELSGRWKDRFIGRGTMVELEGWTAIVPEGETPTVEQVVEIFHAIRRSGNLLEVRWGPEIRRGIMARFEPTWQRLDVCEWSVRFEWTQAGRSLPSPFTSATNETASASSDVTSSLSDMNDVLAMMPQLTIPDVALQAIAFGASIAAAVVDMVDTIASISGVPAVTMDEFQGVASYTGDVVSQCSSLRQVLGDYPPPGIIPTDDVPSLLDGATWGRNMSAALVALAAAAVRAREAVRDRAVPDYLADVRLREGQTLRDVAREYYGAPDDWTVIADANGLIGSVHPPGTRVLVPRREGRAA